MSIRIIEIGPYAEFLQRRWEIFLGVFCRHVVSPNRYIICRQANAQELHLSIFKTKILWRLFVCVFFQLCVSAISSHPLTGKQGTIGKCADHNHVVYIVYTVYYVYCTIYCSLLYTTKMFVVIGRNSTNVWILTYAMLA